MSNYFVSDYTLLVKSFESEEFFLNVFVNKCFLLTKAAFVYQKYSKKEHFYKFN